MADINDTLSKLELAQIGWVVPDILRAVSFLSGAVGVTAFPPHHLVRAQDIGMTYHGKAIVGEWQTTQTYHAGIFIELIQPLSGQSMFHDYLARHREGGVQHFAYRLKVNDFERMTEEIKLKGYKVMSEVDHPIAKMIFFDTYEMIGVATEIMGVTEEGWKAIEGMKGGG